MVSAFVRFRREVWLSLIVSALLLGLLPAAAQSTVTCPGAPPPRLSVGGQAVVSPGDPNNVRAQPSVAGERVGQIAAGEHFTITGEPVCADGYLWWPLQAGELIGWTVEGQGDTYYLEPVAASPVIAGRSSNLIIDGIALRVPSEVAGAEFAEWIAASTDATLATAVGLLPDHYYVSFTETYTGSYNGALLLPEIRLFPIATLDVNPVYAEMAAQTRDLLAARPTLTSGAATSAEAALPFLPTNAAQVFRAQPTYLDGAGISGVRWLTAYSQAPAALPEGAIIYAFSGLTSAGQYWVTATFPITTPGLGLNVPDPVSDHPGYLAALLVQLEGASVSTPPLTALDDLVTSIRVE